MAEVDICRGGREEAPSRRGGAAARARAVTWPGRKRAGQRRARARRGAASTSGLLPRPRHRPAGAQRRPPSCRAHQGGTACVWRRERAWGAADSHRPVGSERAATSGGRFQAAPRTWRREWQTILFHTPLLSRALVASPSCLSAPAAHLVQFPEVGVGCCHTGHMGRGHQRNASAVRVFTGIKEELPKRSWWPSDLPPSQLLLPIWRKVGATVQMQELAFPDMVASTGVHEACMRWTVPAVKDLPTTSPQPKAIGWPWGRTSAE
nr:uncharacterized protein LOC105863025 [Microcebus murinus]